MTLKPLRVLAVGRLKTPFWKSAAEHYITRLARWRNLVETCVKDGPASMPPAERSSLEGRQLLAAMEPADIVICLDERGMSLDSPRFARWLAELSENTGRRPCFVVGGAFGLDEAVRRAARHLIAFGPQTLPHELARVVLYEQLYRAESLTRGLPYHH